MIRPPQISCLIPPLPPARCSKGTQCGSKKYVNTSHIPSTVSPPFPQLWCCSSYSQQDLRVTPEPPLSTFAYRSKCTKRNTHVIPSTQGTPLNKSSPLTAYKPAPLLHPPTCLLLQMLKIGGGITQLKLSGHKLLQFLYILGQPFLCKRAHSKLLQGHRGRSSIFA